MLGLNIFVLLKPSEELYRDIYVYSFILPSLGRISERWEYGYTLGRVFAVLYFSEKPLDLNEIAQQVGCSVSSVSLQLGRLE